MALTTAFAIYFIIWWVVLFAVLPWGVRSQEESGEVVPGSDPGAPNLPKLLLKLIWTTIDLARRVCDLRRRLQLSTDIAR